jgi:hypothetical protein
MNKVDLYIDNTRADAFNDESISLELSTQNIKDIGKVFGEFSQTFSLPATKTNNGIFKHYYNVDIVGGFDANVRIDAIIEVNTIIFREGSIELEGLQFKNGEPYAYNVTFYGKTASLKDEFGEDQLTDLDLSAYDHDYNITNIENGLADYVSGTGSTIIYPLISSSHNWYYNSASSDEEIDNIHYHSGGGGHIHGVQYYDLKPAIKVKAILDAIEADYGITFNSNFFDTADFAKLFMWCHRKEGYMFKGQRDSYPTQTIDFQSATGSFNLLKDAFEPTTTVPDLGILRLNYNFSFISGSEVDFSVVRLRDGKSQKIATTRLSTAGSTSGTFILYDLDGGDSVYFEFSPPADWGGGTIQLSCNIEGTEDYAPYTQIFTATTGGLIQTYSTELVVADQMPEQKIIDFLSGLVKMFNLVVTYEGGNTYKIEPLDDWYADGTTHDFTRYIDTTEYSANRADLYRRISFKYQETEALFGERYRNTSGGGVGYGDLRADFTYDGSDFEVENTFENMLFEKLSDQNTGLETNIMVGKSIDKDLEPYIGSPYIFYVPQRVTLTDSIALVNGGSTEITDVWLVSNCNAVAAEDITQTLNYGSELDPLTQQVQTGGLYETYWQDYITDLYSTSRRVYRFSAIVPLNIMLQLKTNDKLKIVDRYYIINNVSLDLTTGQATLELLNDV